MAQMHFYVPDGLEKAIRKKAEKSHLSVSKFLAEVVKREVSDEWPEGYAESVFGKWQGEPLKREPEGEYEKRLGF